MKLDRLVVCRKRFPFMVIVSVDSSVLWSIFKGEYTARAWLDLLVDLSSEHSLIVCDIVIAELAPYFANIEQMKPRLDALDIDFDPITESTAFSAGLAFRDYRRKGGPRDRLIPDFLIASHAIHQANGLAASDLGFMRRYFPDLTLFQPQPNIES